MKAILQQSSHQSVTYAYLINVWGWYDELKGTFHSKDHGSES